MPLGLSGFVGLAMHRIAFGEKLGLVGNPLSWDVFRRAAMLTPCREGTGTAMIPQCASWYLKKADGGDSTGDVLRGYACRK